MVESLLFCFFLSNTAYVLLLSLAGLFYKKLTVTQSTVFNQIAILVPAYKEDNVIVGTTRKLLSLKYPGNHFDVVIIADSLKAETLSSLKNTGAIIMPVSFPKSTKSNALNYALSNLWKPYDIAIVMDADNNPSSNLLEDINDLFNLGYPIVQCQRVAKNNGSAIAVLDGVSEAINNHLFRQGSNALGLSCSLIGSGMTFPFQLLKAELSLIDSAVEDKALQIALVEKGHRIYYRKGTTIQDEKVDNSKAYKNQRRRWIAGQYQTLKDHFFSGLCQLCMGNFNYFNLAVLHNFFPSRINSVILLFTCSSVLTWISYPLYEGVMKWWLITALYVLALVIAIPRSYFSKKLVLSFLLLPTLILKTIQATFQSSQANKRFIHTEHKVVE